jgi:hypothetical protein
MLLAADPFTLLVFAGMVAAAIAMRYRRGDVHKHLMLLATLSLTSVAIGRLLSRALTTSGWHTE